MESNHTCILCSESFHLEKNSKFFLCIKCQKLLEQHFFNKNFKKSCPTCSLPILTENSCVNCKDEIITAIDQKQTCFLYSGIIKELISYYKFRNIIQLSDIFSHYIQKALEKFNHHIILIPIPGNIKNIKKRGWDQVLEIVYRIKHERISVYELLKQNKKHKQQKTLDKSQRIIQAKNKFTIDENMLEKIINDLPHLDQFQIFLIDDILTTGATIESAAAVILNVLDVPIHAITLAMD